MSRTKRKYSKTGLYHVMIRGVSKQMIYLEKADEEKFMSLIDKYKKKYNFELHAYVLMGNHAHLMIKAEGKTISDIMRCLNSSYAMYFNRKYDRVGPLFQGRFRSIPINDEKYYLSVIKYIHNNPRKAGLTRGLKYRWSSYNEYKNRPIRCETKYAIKMCGSKEKLIDFMNDQEEEKNINKIKGEWGQKNRVNASKTMEKIKKIFGKNNIFFIQEMDVKTRRPYLEKLLENGFTIKQAAQYTGLSEEIVLKSVGRKGHSNR